MRHQSRLIREAIWLFADATFLNGTQMGIDELRRKAREAVNAADFQSSLPAGECDNATVRLFLDRRREEIVVAARRALNHHSGLIPSETVLRLLYGEVSEEEFAILTAA